MGISNSNDFNIFAILLIITSLFVFCEMRETIGSTANDITSTSQVGYTVYIVIFK